MTIHYQAYSRDEAYSVTEEEDDEMDDWLDNCDKCSDCSSRTRGSALACAPSITHANVISSGVVGRAPFGYTCMILSGLCASTSVSRANTSSWQRIVRVQRLITFWRRVTAAPDSKAFKRAAKRFRAMCEVE